MSTAPVTIALYGYLATLAGKHEYVTSCGTVGDAIRELAGQLPPDARHHLPDPQAGLLFGVHLVLNDAGLTLPAALGQPLSPGDRLSIVSPVSGG